MRLPSNSEIIDGVIVSSPIKSEFENIYLKVRQLENRFYSDEEVALLPFASKNNLHKREWELRVKSLKRFKSYLETLKNKSEILDIGCGNGWFCGHLSKIFSCKFYCVDVNLTELKQAVRVFKNQNITFYFADINENIFQEKYFDFILLNSTVQYFSDLNKLIRRLFEFLKEDGEIHIIDSPFYTESERINARKRTESYFEKLNVPEMIEYYHHHSYSELKTFKHKILYKPKKSILNFIKRNSPFPWIRLIK